MTRLDDPSLVADEYADDARLRRRAAAFTGEATAFDARVPLVKAVVEAGPQRILEVGCGWGELAEWVGRDTRADVVAVDLRFDAFVTHGVSRFPTPLTTRKSFLSPEMVLDGTGGMPFLSLR